MGRKAFITFLRGTAERWLEADLVLATSEKGFQLPDDDYPNGRWKTGRDALKWSELPYDDESFVRVGTTDITYVIEGTP